VTNFSLAGSRPLADTIVDQADKKNI